MSAKKSVITVEELLLFNDELRALARAGVPLESGLTAISKDLPGRLGRWVDAVGVRIEQGEGLSSVLNDPQFSLPPMYAAVVAAGIRAGRLPAALESLSKSLARSIDFRRNMTVALVYPIMLLLLASAVFAFTWSRVYPLMQAAIRELLEGKTPFWFGWLDATVEHGIWALFAVWFLVLSVTAWWFFRSRRAMSSGLVGRWPSIYSVHAAGRIATFCETLAVLLEQQVPLTEALRLAGASSGDRGLAQGVETLASQLESGDRTGARSTGLPPLLSWLILTNAPSAHLVKTLRQAAAGKRDYAARASLTLGIYLPIVCSAVVGGFVAVYYSVLVMVPFLYVLKELGQP